MSGQSGPPYSGQNRYFRDPGLVNQLVRDREYRDSGFGMEEYRRPYGQFDGYEEHYSYHDPRVGGSSYDGRPLEHFEHFGYDDPRQSVRFAGLRYDDVNEGGRYYQDRDFGEGPSGSGYADEELYEREAPGRREDRVDQRKRKRREKEEEEKEDELSEEGDSDQEDGESPTRKRGWLPKASKPKRKKVEAKPNRVVPEKEVRAGSSKDFSGSD